VEPGTIHILHCPFSNWQLGVTRIVCTYTGVKRYEKGTVCITRNREKTEVRKKREGEAKVTADKGFL